MSARDGVLIGGMHDGAVITGMGRRDWWLMPIPAPVAFVVPTADDWRFGPVAAYRLVLTLGRPSLDDCGRYRYAYAGTR